MIPEVYPTPAQVEAWCERVLASADAVKVKVTPLAALPL